MLFTDFADVFVACFVGFTRFVALFRKLHHDELTVAIVLGVKLHNGVGGGGRAGEEIEDHAVLRISCNISSKSFYIGNTLLSFIFLSMSSSPNFNSQTHRFLRVI